MCMASYIFDAWAAQTILRLAQSKRPKRYLTLGSGLDALLLGHRQGVYQIGEV